MAFQDPYGNKNFLGNLVDDAAATAFVLANRWDSTQDGLGVPVDGTWYYSTTTNEFVGRMNGAWVPITGSVAITGNGEIYVDAVDGNDVTGDGSIGKPYQTFKAACDAQPIPGPLDVAVFLQPLTFHLAPGVYAEGMATYLPQRMHITITGDNCRLSTPNAIMWTIDPQLWNTYGLATDKDAPTVRFVRKPSVGWEPGLKIHDDNYPQGFRLVDGSIQVQNANAGCGFPMPDFHVVEINGAVRESFYVFNDASGTADELDATRVMKLYLKDSPAQDDGGNHSWICAHVDTSDVPGGWFQDNRIDIYAARSSVFMCGVCRINWMEDCEYFANFDRDIFGNPYAYGRVDGGYGNVRGAVIHRSKALIDSYFGMGPDPSVNAQYHTTCNAIVFDESSLVTMAMACPDLGGLSFVGFTLDNLGAYGRGWWNGESEYRSAHDCVRIPASLDLSSDPTAGWRLFEHTYDCAPNWVSLGVALSASNMLTIELQSGTYVMGASKDLDQEYVSVVGAGSSPVLEASGDARTPSTRILVPDGIDLGWDADSGRMERIGILKIATTPGQACLLMRKDSPSSVFKELFFRGTGVSPPYAVMLMGVSCSSAWYDCHTDLNGFIYGGSATGLYKNCTAGSLSFGASSGPDVGATFDGTAMDCVAGTCSFGVASNGGNVLCAGTLTRCVVPGNYAFGVSVLTGAPPGTGGNAECSATMVDCEARGYSYGYAEHGHSTFSGEASDCIGTERCFGCGADDSTMYDMLCSGDLDHCVAGIYSFGAATVQPASASFTGTAKHCESGDYSFGYGASSPGTCSGTIEDTIGGDGCFGTSVDNNALCDAILNRVTGGDGCFGVTNNPPAGVTAAFQGVATDCHAGVRSFGSCIVTADSVACCTVKGSVTRCTAGERSFGSGGAAVPGSCNGVYTDCVGGEDCWGSRVGGVGGAEKCTFIRCYRSTRTGTDVWHLGSSNKLSGCTLIMLGDFPVIDLYDDTAPAVLYDCTIRKTTPGANPSITDSGGGGMDIKMAHCRLGIDIGATVTNLIVDGYNVIDPEVEAF
ncbi:MAG: hypothetical protein WC683_01570 [bacterium]